MGNAIRVLRTGDDPNQRHIRECAIVVALQSAGHKPPRRTRTTPRHRELTDDNIDEALGHTSANHGAFLIAQRITGLSRDLLDLILGDQLTDQEILGCAVPPRAQPILRALPRCNMPVMSAPRSRAAKPPLRRTSTSSAAPRPTDGDPKLPMLFSGRRRWIAIEDIPEADRHEYASSTSDKSSTSTKGMYRASHLALYGNFQLPAPPIRSLTNEWDDLLTSTGNPTDI